MELFGQALSLLPSPLIRKGMSKQLLNDVMFQ
jgi:hypothetical protein